LHSADVLASKQLEPAADERVLHSTAVWTTDLGHSQWIYRPHVLHLRRLSVVGHVRPAGICRFG